MIALVTSCINPFAGETAASKSYLNVEQRLSQTLTTLHRLADHPFDKIFLLDNSYSFDFNAVMNDIPDRVSVRHYSQYPFANKGINEMLLLLAALPELPDNEPIFKISGRYYPTENFVCRLSEGYDFKFKGYHYPSKRGTVSTRGYFVRNKRLYEEFLLKCIGETFAYPKRMVGLRSAWNAIAEIARPHTPADFNTSIEFASARVLKAGNYRVELVDVIGIAGQVAGSEKTELINE